MATPSNSLALCNLALDQLRSDAVLANISSPTTSLETMFSRNYDFVRRSILRQFVWNFAKKRSQLTATGSTPTFGYDDTYTLPADLVRLLTLGDETNPETEYEIEGSTILISNDAGVLDIVYIFDQTDVTKFDALFMNLLVLELAVAVHQKVGTQAANLERIKDERLDIRLAAAAVDGQERPPRRIQKSKFISARQSRSARVAGTYTVFP